MARYLVTGGAGFIGSHIVEALLRDRHEVRVIDDFSTGRRQNMEGFTGQVDVIEGDIRDELAVDRAVKGMDYVIHQAALASVPRSIENPVATNNVNVGGTLNLLEAARKHSIKSFVYASSSSVYGDSEELPKIESMTPNPRSPYAVSKLAGEWYCRVYSVVHGLPTVSLRYFNVFGPRQDPNSQYAAVIPIFTKAMLGGEKPTVFGDGEQSRDFTYINNVVAANLLASRAELPGARVYNVACGGRFTLNVLYRKLQDIVGTKVTPTYAAPRVGDVRHSQASIDAIRAELGYEIGVEFLDGLERTVRWYREVELAA